MAARQRTAASWRRAVASDAWLAVHAEILRVLPTHHAGLARRLLSLAALSLARTGGLPLLVRRVTDTHARLRAEGRGTPLPALGRPLAPRDAAAALLRKAAASHIARLHFGCADGAQDGTKLSAAAAAARSGVGAAAAAAAWLDAGALAALREQRCVHKALLDAARAAALFDEFESLDGRRRRRGGGEEGAAASVFAGSEGALCNQARGRQFFNLSADDARRRGAPTVAYAIDVLCALAAPLAAAAGGAWWGADVRAPARATIQLYPPGASYKEHTDASHIGDGWVTPRGFTCLVYAHAGWEAGHGGELAVWSLEVTRSGTSAHASERPCVVPPTGGTLVIFPAHLMHAVAPVVGAKRFAVTVWLSLGDRELQRPSEAAEVADSLSSTEWLEVMTRFDRRSFLRADTGAGAPPGTVVAHKCFNDACFDTAVSSLEACCRT